VGLTGEPGSHGRVMRELGRKHLYCNRTVEPPIAGAVHYRHAAAPQLGLHVKLMADGTYDTIED
jgi:hypothetical protein